MHQSIYTFYFTHERYLSYIMQLQKDFLCVARLPISFHSLSGSLADCFCAVYMRRDIIQVEVYAEHMMSTSMFPTMPVGPNGGLTPQDARSFNEIAQDNLREIELLTARAKQLRVRWAGP